ncbi:hypothetical protein [Rhodocyclus purpureus]|uniref:hypothetical protein n=1 Tax=Rhodocyclus purpureus TaxID=1067 RepID=UPI00191138C1|nr:hypothetical protein [Rhodocyclus purpureus]MBK5915124.1 hypothetical protein [Rhodocyclus purpureus]
MSAPDLQALAGELLEELSAANKIIQGALAVMSPAEKIRWAERNDREGLVGEDGGTTRANPRLALIQRAGAALREAKQASGQARTALGGFVAKCVGVDIAAETLTFEADALWHGDLGCWYTIIPAKHFESLVVMPQDEIDEFVRASQLCALRDACIAPAAIMARAVHTRAQEVQS